MLQSGGVTGVGAFLDGRVEAEIRAETLPGGAVGEFVVGVEERAYSRHSTGLQHLAFSVRTRSAVRDVFQHVLDSGDEVIHEPREFPEYPPPYYATFWLDPFAIMLEAVCHYDRD